ncbi:MAG: hypothetical protein RIS70_4335, partial [Planctomycetota bacterium]
MLSRFLIEFPHRSWRLFLLALCTLALLSRMTVAAEPQGGKAAPRKIVLIAGKKSHGPEGNGIHDYPWSAKLLKVMLDNSNIRDQVRVEYHRDGWPRDEKTLDDASAIVIISDGRDGDLYEEALHLENDQRVATVRKHVARGCGIVTFHFSTFTPDKYAQDIFDWTGGYFDWEEDGQKKWYSAIQHLESPIELVQPKHPISRGVKPFAMKEEFYFNLRFTPQRDTLDHLLSVPNLPGRDPDGKVVAWAKRRPDGGRGFGTTCGHFYDNWRHDDFRKFILNGIAWAAQVDPPAEGVLARFYTQEEITTALTGVQATAKATFDDTPIRALIFAGNEAHKWHNWEKTTPAIKQLLEADPRLRVDVSFDIEDLGRRDLKSYQLIVQNYCNWHDGKPLSEPSRKAFVDYLQSGGGLILIHFANGAFHPSLPEAQSADWPEYRKIVRRVWNHQGQGEAQSGHDAFGNFTVQIAEIEHPITGGLKDFEVTDELYFKQDGVEPISPLIKARSKVTSRDEPLAWTYEYGKGRIFQTLLGHSEKTYESFEASELIRRAAAWVARRPVVPRPRPAEPEAKTTTATQPPPKKPLSPDAILVAGRFDKALDARQVGLDIPGRAEYRTPPITVECWAQLRQKANYNILIANELKTSATHWELFSMAGTGMFTAYLPGMTPDHVHSKKEIADGKWHHVAMTLEPNRVRLYVDGQQVADERVEFNKRPTIDGGLSIGKLVGAEIGCDGLIDEVRITRGIRTIDKVPDQPYPFDDKTIGLWHLDILDPQQRSPDDSSLKNHAKQAQADPSPARKYVKDHWGVEAVGFAWTETDSRDGRWQRTDVGRFLASTVMPLPDGPVRKGLSIRLGESSQGALCYDTEFGKLRAVWTGEFLTFDPARFGLIVAPKVAGQLRWSQPEGPAWPGATFRYLGMHLNGEHSLLSYRVNDTTIAESPWLDTPRDQLVLTRLFEITPHQQALAMRIAEFGSDATIKIPADRPSTVQVNRGTEAFCWQLAGEIAGSFRVRQEGEKKLLELTLPARDTPARFALRWSPNAEIPVAELFGGATTETITTTWTDLQRAGPRRWTKPIVTKGSRARDDQPYVVDTLTLPFENPYRALFFPGGLDFFPNGDIAIATVHGDVWRVQGVDETLERLTWTRLATGLFQPLGVKILDGEVHVLGRDQITRLRDTNGDGEADEYDNIFNSAFTSAGGHDYVAGLETDRQGNFYFVHATQGVVKIDPRADKLEVVATGLRNPVGLSVGPDDTITAAPQEGEWTPASNIIQVKAGGHYGYRGPQVTA